MQSVFHDNSKKDNYLNNSSTGSNMQLYFGHCVNKEHKKNPFNAPNLYSPWQLVFASANVTSSLCLKVMCSLVMHWAANAVPQGLRDDDKASFSFCAPQSSCLSCFFIVCLSPFHSLMTAISIIKIFSRPARQFVVSGDTPFLISNNLHTEIHCTTSEADIKHLLVSK